MITKDFNGLTIRLGSLKVIITKSGLLLICPPCGSGEDGWADHLTLVLPKEGSNAEHDFDPHLTRRWEGNRKRKEPLSDGGVSMEDLHCVVEESQEAILARWLSYTRPADLELFAMANYWVVAMRHDEPRLEAMFSTIAKCFTPADGVKVVGLSDVEQDLRQLNFVMLDIMFDSLRSPLDLDDCRDIRQPLPLIRWCEESPWEQIGMLQYFPHGLPTGNPKPGWYLTHSNWLTPENVAEWCPKLAGPKVINAVEKVMRAFGHAPVADEGHD